MRRFDPATATVHVRTYKEGLLSRLGHDLLLAVGRFQVDVEDGVEAWFDTASIAVVHALREGRPDPAALSAADRAQIQRNLAEEVLLTRRFPRIAFRADAFGHDGDDVSAAGQLTLRGRTFDLEVRGRRSGADLVVAATLDQPSFGITPFTALLGALRIQPQVDVEIRLRGWSDRSEA